MLKKITLIFLIIINIFNININENSISKIKPLENTISTPKLTEINEEQKKLKNPITSIATLTINNKTYLLYDPISNENTVEKNVEILSDSTIPPIPNTNIYLAAHSGEGNTAYFNELFNIKENDLIYLNHNSITYTYQINSISNQIKDGNIEIKKNNETNLILTTCSNIENQQLVIISKLKESI